MLIELNGISKVYVRGTEEVHALRSVDLVIEDNEYVALMGPSGSGKSTLMNILGCLDSPTDGTYRMDGTDVSRMNANELAEVRNSRVGFIFQTFNLLPRASALQNVELPLIYNGQCQRVAIARALANGPSLLLADEPTGNLDSRTGEEIMILFDALQDEGNTVLLVTHDPVIALQAKRLIRIHDGSIASDEKLA